MNLEMVWPQMLAMKLGTRCLKWYALKWSRGSCAAANPHAARISTIPKAMAAERAGEDEEEAMKLPRMVRSKIGDFGATKAVGDAEHK